MSRETILASTATLADAVPEKSPIPVSADENWSRPYQIIETDSGLGISQSRVLLFDVMEAYNEGDSIYQICETFNLTPLQVKIAIEYIEKHRAALEPELVKAIEYRKEREAYHRRLAAERWKKIAQSPMTPERAAFYALLEKHRTKVNGAVDASHSQ